MERYELEDDPCSGKHSMTRTDGFRSDDHGSVVYLTLAVLVAALGGLLFGYDTAVIAGGDRVSRGALQTRSHNGRVGDVECLGRLSHRDPRSPALSVIASAGRNALILAAVFFFISAVGTGLPRTFTAFVFYRWLGGLGVGMASLISPMYIAEISPCYPRPHGQC